MQGTVVLCLMTLQFSSIAAQEVCTDFRGRVIFNGLHYVPSSDTCTLCVCDNGIPKVCKAVLCSPPQDCRSFRVGNTCCEFICLDDVVKPADAAEANVRVAAGGAAALVLLTVAVVVYRVRRIKRRRPPHADDQRSLTSIGYISGSMGYMGGTCETALAAWKPHGNYLPRGEAPPPYDEVIAQCRPDTIRISNETAFHRTYPSTMEALTRPDESVQCSGHAYVNIPRPIQQMANTQNCFNAPLLQPVHPPEAREPNPMPHHPFTANVLGFPSTIRLTGSLGAISNRGLLSVLQRDPEHERPHNVPGFYANSAGHTSLHRTIPRISTAVDASALEACFSRERGLGGEVRRSFHRAERAALPALPPHAAAAGRSVPRNLDRAAMDARPALPAASLSRMSGPGVRSRAPSEEQTVCTEPSPPPPAPELPPPSPAPAAPPPATAPAPAPAPTSIPTPAGAPPPHSTLPLTIDKPSCVCSYEQANVAGSEEPDDYRSECENCKSASSSRWVLEEGWEEEAADGTQTLQRRPVAAALAAPPAASTLPQPVTKQSRTVMGPPSNWENWFNTIPDSDTDSEEE
ncbi:hypothetical protein evm_003912 [Chilo suppressalis]|nr:hypothetical protein evm_003912 [Chilo suppressalis]